MITLRSATFNVQFLQEIKHPDYSCACVSSKNMKINGLTALVTGANRGLGRAFVQALRDAGCTKIYAAARTIEGTACDAVVEPVQLDITKIGQVSSAATQCHDVSILI